VKWQDAPSAPRYTSKIVNGRIVDVQPLMTERQTDRAQANLETEVGSRFEGLVIDLAAEFMNLESVRVDDALEDCLRRIVEALRLDRSTLLQRSGDDLVVTHSWAFPGHAPFPQTWGRTELPWCFEQVMRGASIVFARVDDLPAAAAVDKALLERLGPKSNVTIPLIIGGDTMGALAFGSMRSERVWSPAVLARLRSVAFMITGVLARRRTEGDLRTALAEVQELRARLEQENHYLREQARGEAGAARIVGQGRAIQELLSLVARVAPTDAPVLITGETGVGKEIVAEAIHARSARAGRTMVTVNCAALAPTLVEAELFGREKGAYTGALTRQIGRFELAHGSTLFLDEVSEIPHDLQAKLLRVLQNGEFERLGSPRTLHADVRIIAATNRDLDQAVSEGRFRADLYFRLAVFPVMVPPLRERPEDILPLVLSIVDEIGRKMGRHIDVIDEDSLAELRGYAWPGNIRELRNLVERAIILGDDRTLRIDLPQRRESATSEHLTLEGVERHHILRMLENAGWRVRGAHGAAQLLGLRPSTLETRMVKLGIRRPCRAPAVP
jgi:formate hydrogenlyase transcriptional activator